MKKDNTLLELVTGIILVGVVVQIVCLIAFPNDLYNAIGLWSGVAIGSGMAIHMKHSTIQSHYTDRSEKQSGRRSVLPHLPE